MLSVYLAIRGMERYGKELLFLLRDLLIALVSWACKLYVVQQFTLVCSLVPSESSTSPFFCHVLFLFTFLAFTPSMWPR